jgi:hypothetical protein
MVISNLYAKDRGYMHLRAKMFYSHWPAQALSLPKSTVIEVSAAPHMEAPIYEQQLTPAEAFGDGIKIEAPYGWYDFDWKLICDGLTVRPRLDPYVLLVPYPFPSKTAAGM